MFYAPAWISIGGRFSARAEQQVDNAVYLTFDDGPSKTSLAVAEELRGRDVAATFFLLGRQAEENPGVANQLRHLGHEIGFHGYDHLNPWAISPARLRTDYELGLKVLEKQGNESIRWFRPPYGRVTPWGAAWARSRNMNTILWDINPGDYKPDTRAEVVTTQVLKRVFAGSVILLHEQGAAWRGSISEVASEIGELVERLREQGYSMEKLPR